MKKVVSSIFACCLMIVAVAQPRFVSVKGSQFQLNGKPYYYVGTNCWYGGLLSLDGKGRERMVKELDFLKKNGVNNLRILAGAEGEGQINGSLRVEPPLQIAPGVFKAERLDGLDFLLSEMDKRNMKAVLFLTNNWEWSGGFLQYLNWNGLLEESVLRRKMEWDEMRDIISQFYGCNNCISQYHEQVKLIVGRVNHITHKSYTEDAAIMAWEIANEPRPMRPAAIQGYKNFLKNTAALIKSIDPKHLVTIGSEGDIGSESPEVFIDVHNDPHIDYVTMHIWPKNWQWFKDTSIGKDFEQVLANTKDYINKHVAYMQKMKKPLVIEEFGLPRDHQSFRLNTPTTYRDRYYGFIFETLVQSAKNQGVIGGANFWAFSGSGRPSYKQHLWNSGEDMLGDPPFEEQGLNSVFDTDKSTWKIIQSTSLKLKN
jgi:mannan endo-1,4-beta-mannosidase